ncbi:AraC family L-rhamnose operon regulatory protein RhaS [Cricetibacter osteomyelitidis]|uniref:AraC family L-rhamnose operon regulatory protein RhaS n=1 Tax=Cricetibacter osteomyelitidis TaxID=1521931 RepID=A0A4R2TIV1_9PAST|nr:helix-turn-helix domain-containing protein [Cricetibacter osteomyelitidis]TCP94732.1 AraC family L-rhamnose operon regulatory protein RhaS [Cricetibacter osteomyelitidis]
MANVEKFLFEDYFRDNNELLSFSYTDPEINIIEHTHEFAELVIVDKGYGLQVFNGAPYFIQEGDVFLVKEDDRHFYNELGTLKLMNLQINTGYQFHYLNQVIPLLEKVYIKEDQQITWLMPKEKEYCVELIRKLPECDGYSQDVRRFKIEALFMQILETIITGQELIQKNNTQYKMRNLLIYLQQHYAEQIDWQWLSEHFFITYKTITRRLNELTGMSPVNYLNRLRVLSAKEKLHHSDYSITEIAGLCGFNNSDYFTKCYKKNFGVLPSDERKLLNMIL